MLRRLVPCSLGLAGLLLLAAILWLPSGLGARLQTETAPEPPSRDMQLVAAECPFFVTFRPADFTSDELARAVIQDLPRELERSIGQPLSEVDRITFALVRSGTVLIVRTRKAYDADKLREALQQRHPRFDFKDKDKGRNEKMAMTEKKVGGKTIYYSGGLYRYTEGICPYDKTTFLRGEVNAIANLLVGKGKSSEHMTRALGLMNKHSLVLALEGKKMVTLIKQQRQEREQEMKKGFRDKGFKDGPDRKDGFKDKVKDDEIAFQADDKKDKAKSAEEDLDDLLGDEFGRGDPFTLLLKPFLKSEYGLLTADIKKTYTVSAVMKFTNKEDMEDGETILKAFLYMVREMAAVLPKQEREFRGLSPLTVPVQKAVRAAKIERKENTLSAFVSLTPEAGLVKKVRDSVAEERKGRDKDVKVKDRDKRPQFKEKDRPRLVDKDK